MDDIKNSQLLDKILEYATSIGEGSKNTLTAERYVVSIFDVVNGETAFEVDQGDRNMLSAVMKEYFPAAAHDFSDVKELFINHINNSKHLYYLDGVYMLQHIQMAKNAAKIQSSPVLTPAILLSCIFNDPCTFIRELFAENNKKAARQTTPETGAAREPSKNDVSVAPDASKIPADASETEDKNPKAAVAKLTEKVKSTHDALTSSIFGQDNAVSVFTTGYFQAELLSMTDKNRTRPRATFLFAGPPGVGKTFLAEKAAEVLGLPFMRFDMSEYCDNESAIEFIGSDAVYKNAKSGNFTDYVSKNPKCIVLFDEIEKAHISIIHLFLQILDAGRIRDSKTDQEISLADTILIFTTNAGKQLYENSETGDFSALTRKVILNALQKDVNTATGAPFFPAAICSRFASGNVVMFNHIAAHDLRKIAKKEVLRHAENFEKEVGIKIDVDEQVYTALLFAEGGTADARMIRSRAESFFDNELFELFRLLASEKVPSGIENLESISITVDVPKANKEIYSLFSNSDSQEILLFSSENTAHKCRVGCPSVAFCDAQDIEKAKSMLRNGDMSFVLIDLSFGRVGEREYLNIEDAESTARDFFWYVRENHADMPIYLLQSPDNEMNSEEKLSFLRQGVRGIITLDTDDGKFSSEISSTAEKLHQQNSMIALAAANKLINFETAQTIVNDGKKAVIRLFDFEMTVAMDAEDTKSIVSNVSKPNVRFDQVIGAEDAKKELMYFVEYLKNPKKYLGTGVSAPKGVLLYGPPGTGKTMLAKAMARESDVTFITAEGNQFRKKYLGEGSEKVHELFRTARKYAPAILFIDEIDAIARERVGGSDGQAEVEATLTALLAEMDGFKNDSARPVFVLAATNFDVESGGAKSLDPALMRRFDRRVYIDLPNREERTRYMLMRFEENSAFELSGEEIENIAIRSTGMSLAELASIIELSLRTAIRDGNLKVTDEIFEEAFETFKGGETRLWDASQLERVARHEAGHAFLCWQSGEKPSYVTIVARGDHGGYMRYDAGDGKAIYTKDELLARIRTALGGRAAEIAYYGRSDGISTGASGDLASATSMARHIICTYGMDEKFGLAVIDQESPLTGELSEKVTNAVNEILSGEMETAIGLIEKNKQSIDALVEQLISKNHLTGNEIKEIFQKNS